MDLFSLIHRMHLFVRNKDWTGLEVEFETIGRSLAGAELTNKILDIDTSEYQRRLSAGLSPTITKAKNHEAKAVYFEYDLDNNWAGHFFICQDYNPISEYEPGDDDWACEWIEHFDAGDFVPFGELYVPGFDVTEVATGVNSFLIARTVAAFGRSCDDFRSEAFAICMAFHDQDPIVRVHEPFGESETNL